MRRMAGFTLIEMMIVIAIISILAAIAIPNMLRARIQANESAAIGNLRVIVGAQTGFCTSFGRFADSFDELVNPPPADSPKFLDGDWNQPRNGYTYVMSAASGSFQVNANAQEYGVTGDRGFYVDASGIIRFRTGADADSGCPPIGSPAS
ncbi:MAG TPA: prepilin-type N-terminal cleavage/methylation domain-containing protein [Candidatus Hydrogenedentes bacterium]|nr:prepilin-type N-terminal cleavage/methylation domain-containing protein [Candidatus Hydrogenedentota bacterium]